MDRMQLVLVSLEMVQGFLDSLVFDVESFVLKRSEILVDVLG